MFSKITEAIQLLVNNFVLFVMVVLTVWLPGNLAINYLAYYVVDPEDVGSVMGATLWIEGIFGPLYIGAMVYALWHIKQGRPIGYAEAMQAGLKNWGRLFIARFLAGLLILLGFILIVPGILLALRYALLDSAVVLEGKGANEARMRSTDLTHGIRLQIFATAAIGYIGFLFVSILVYMPIGVVQALEEVRLPVLLTCDVVADCVLDIAFSVLQIAIFLFYWEQRQSELVAYQTTVGETAVEEDAWTDSLPQLENVRDDENPYRPPQT